MVQTTSSNRTRFAARHAHQHVDRMLDQAIEDTFPTSDPVSLAMPHQRADEESRWGAFGSAAATAALPLLVIGGVALALWLRRGRA